MFLSFNVFSHPAYLGDAAQNHELALAKSIGHSTFVSP
jgi:hypothetical protein